MNYEDSVAIGIENGMEKVAAGRLLGSIPKAKATLAERKMWNLINAGGRIGQKSGRLPKSEIIKAQKKVKGNKLDTEFKKNFLPASEAIFPGGSAPKPARKAISRVFKKYRKKPGSFNEYSMGNDFLNVVSKYPAEHQMKIMTRFGG